MIAIFFRHNESLLVPILYNILHIIMYVIVGIVHGFTFLTVP